MEGEREEWLMWSQSIVKLHWAAWIDWTVHTQRYGNLACVCVKHKRTLPGSCLVVAILSSSAFCPWVNSALKPAGGGKTVCVSSLLCHLLFYSSVYERCSRLLALPAQSSCFAFQMRNLSLWHANERSRSGKLRRCLQSMDKQLSGLVLTETWTWFMTRDVFKVVLVGTDQVSAV